MSLIDKLLEKLSGSSANLQKIKDASEERRSAKSSAAMPKVSGEIENAVAAALKKRIKASEQPSIAKDAPKGEK
jgi:hypothetical protein